MTWKLEKNVIEDFHELSKNGLHNIFYAPKKSISERASLIINQQELIWKMELQLDKLILGKDLGNVV